MIKLTITDSSGRERDVEIETEPQVFGRGEDSDVVLGSRSISRHHMKIWEENGKVMVEDLSGGTGITIDGEEVTGTFQLEPGADLEAGVFIFNIPGSRLDTALDAAIGEEIPVPMLNGTRGPTKGLKIELQEGDNDVGRDPSLYLVIDDPSVSRQHARLTVDAGRFTLVDIRSSNGTFVNNRRIETAELRSGDLVRFGNLEFKFTYGKEVSVGAAALKRKKMMLIGGGALGLLLVIGLGVKICSSEPPPGPRPGSDGPQGPPVEILVEQHLRTAKGFMEEGGWKPAIKELDAALDVHPICRECRVLKSRVEDEIVNKNLYDQCVVDYELNSWRKALDCFNRLPAKSYYEMKSKYKKSECITHLKKYNLSQGMGYFNARRYREAHKHLVAYMKLDPCNQTVYNKWLVKTEKKLRASHIKKGWEPYVWRCETRRASEGMGLDPEEELKARYRDPKIFRAVDLYYKGRVDTAIQELQKIVALERDQGRVEKARELIRDLRVVKGKYADGMSRLMRGKLKGSREQFDQAMSIDRRIMPEGVTSFYRDDIGKQLAEKLHKEALAFFNRGHYLNAFEIWNECLQRNPAAKDCQRGMNKLDTVGDQALGEARRMEIRGNLPRVVQILKHILEITPTESMSHKKAQIWLNKIEEQ